MSKHLKKLLLFIAMFAISAVCYASGTAHNGGAGGHGLVERLAGLVFELALILFAARIGGRLFEKMNFPDVLGEIIAGVIIGPYCLGKIPLPGFEHGIFPVGVILTWQSSNIIKKLSTV